MVVSDKALQVFTILPLNLPLTESRYCFEITQDVIFFPAMYAKLRIFSVTHNPFSVIEEWETLELKDAWPSDELGFSIALAVLYAILFITCLVSLVLNLFLTFVKKENSKTLGDFLALIFLFVLTIRMYLT